MQITFRFALVFLAFVALAPAARAEFTYSPEAGRYQLLFTGQFHDGVAELYRLDTQTGERWFLANGTNWVPSGAMTPGHYQVIVTGATRDGQPQILMINTATGEAWRKISNNWQPIPPP